MHMHVNLYNAAGKNQGVKRKWKTDSNLSEQVSVHHTEWTVCRFNEVVIDRDQK